MPDSVVHRHWECVCTLPLRQAIAEDVFVQLEQSPDALRSRGWALLHPMHTFWRRLLVAEPDGMPRAGLPLDPPGSGGMPISLFTDGTAQCPKWPALRYAAWAVVEVCEVDPWCSTCIAAGRLKGLVQTVPRAEAIAVWAALEYVHQVSRPARLWCDCQFVVDRMQSILQGGFRWDPSQTDSDVWADICRLVQLIGPHALRINKVAAHVASSGQLAPLEEWAAFHNSRVDEAAKAANQARPPVFFQVHGQLVSHQARMLALVQAAQAYIVRVAQLFHRRGNDRSSANDRPRIAEGHPVRRPPVLPRVGADLCERFGSRVVQTVASWWPHALTGDKSRWVSGLQLLLDYQMATGCRGPVFSGPTKGWHEPSWSSRVDLHVHSAGQHVTWFMRVLRAVWHAQGVVVDCRKQRPDSACPLGLCLLAPLA